VQLAWILVQLAWILEQLAWILEQRAWILEQRAWILEQRAWSLEQPGRAGARWSSRSWPGPADLELLARADKFGAGAALVAIFYF